MISAAQQGFPVRDNMLTEQYPWTKNDCEPGMTLHEGSSQKEKAPFRWSAASLIDKPNKNQQ